MRAKAYGKDARRQARHRRIRKKISGTEQRPRLAVFRSNKHLSAQVIDDLVGQTLMGCSTSSKSFTEKTGGNIEAASALGKLVGSQAKEKGITQVVFDRGGYSYHGRIKAFVEAVREQGLQV